MKWLKGLVTLIAILLVIAVAGVTFLLVGIDPNSYKPELEKLALKNNIELSITGDLGWSFFPNLAVAAGATTLSGKTSGIPDISFQQADFILDWKALLSRTIRLRAIAIDGVEITIETIEEAANVATIPAAAASSQTQSDSDTTLPFELAIDQLTLTNGRITIVSKGEPDKVLEQLNLSSKGLNLEGQPFAITLSVATTLPEQPTAFTLTFNSQVKLQLDQQVVELNESTLTLNGLKKLPITLNFDALYNGKEEAVNLTKIKGKVGSAVLGGDINILGLQGTPSAMGQLSVQNLLFSELPIDEAPEGFKKIDISTHFSASETQLKLDQLKLALDNFTINGKLSLKLEGPRQLDMVLKGGHLVLPATAETTAESNANNVNADQAALLTPILAPLLLLEGGKGHIELNLDSLTSDDIKIDQLHLNLFANGNTLDITDLSGAIFDGKFQTTAKIDLREKTPKIKFSQQLDNIDIHNALSTLAGQTDIRGNLSMDFSGISRGDTQEALLANIDGSGKLSVLGLQIDTINVERSYCEMAALIEQTTLNKTWPSGTKLKDMQSNFQWKNQIITFPALTTGLGNLAIAGNGTVNLAQEKYDILITANLNGDSTSETGCHIKSKSIRNRDIPLRCTGSFAENGSGNCLPDKTFINQLLKDKVKDALFDKLLKPSSPKPVDSSESTTPEEPKNKKEQVIDSLLKGLFK